MMRSFIIVCRKGDTVKNIEVSYAELDSMIHNLIIGDWIISHIILNGFVEKRIRKLN